MLTGWFVTLRSPVTAGLRVTPARLVLTQHGNIGQTQVLGKGRTVWQVRGDC